IRLTCLQSDANLRGVLNDVMVGQDVALGMNDESASDSTRCTTWAAAKHVEQRTRLVFLVFVFLADFVLHLDGFDVDDRGFHATSDFGERSGKGFRGARNLDVGLRDRWPAGQHCADANAR